MYRRTILALLFLQAALFSVAQMPGDSIPVFPDDAIFAEFDNESFSNARSIPTSLSATKDLFGGIASYKFSEMRFNLRGYGSQYSGVWLNGINFNDAMSGYSSWALWSGLNDVTRNQQVTSGTVSGDYGIGTVGGTTNIITSPSQLRKGFRSSLATTNSSYRLRGMLTYASGPLDSGWSYAISLSTRQGGNDYVHGVFYNAFAYFAAIEKKWGDAHRLGLMVLGAPTQRGTQQAATQEAYDLVGNNYYNPGWGWQVGKRRNPRVRNYHEPVAMLTWRLEMSDVTELDAATSLRFGRNGYSSLTWYAGTDPRPDYYRAMPSFYYGTTTGAWLYEAWRTNKDDIRHISWASLYDINRNMPGSSVYGGGHRSVNMIEERHDDQLDWSFMTRLSHLFRNGSRLTAGINLRRNRTSYYSEVKDLLGGDYWVDVDKFAERDNAGLDPVPYQNDMAYYNKYGHARGARTGDKYGYNYYGSLADARIWALFNFVLGGVDINLGGEIGHTSIWRHGLWQKGLFLNDSKGDSRKINSLVHTLKTNISYQFSPAHSLSVNIAYAAQSPYFEDAFVSPRTRNQQTPDVTTEKIFSTDCSYNLRLGDFKGRLTGYYTRFTDGSRVISYYDDIESTFTNFAMSHIGRQHFGLEAAVSIPLYTRLYLNSALSWGQYTYSDNPDYIQIQDNSGSVINSGKVYWKDKRVESTPQTAFNAGLSYRTRGNVYLGVDASYYDNMYISMSPVYRTDEVLSPGMTDSEIRALRHQEKFGACWVVGASVGKSWYVDRKYTLGFSLDVRNLLNDQNIKSGGYEQIRLLRNKEASVTKYQAFESKYFYMFGITCYLNLYFRF